MTRRLDAAPSRGVCAPLSIRVAIIAALGLLGSCGPTDDGQSPALNNELPFGGFSVGDEVGSLELSAPSTTTFVLHGTLPVPRHLYTPGGDSPFVLRDTSGNVVQAQTEVVSWYADEADGADVVELIAEVTRPPASAPGDRLRYAVLWQPGPEASAQVDPQVEALLATPNALVLRTQDVFGHSYEADLLADLRLDADGELITLRSGSVANQVRTHETLLPVAPVTGNTGTLPHMMGVHSYVTTWRDQGYLSLDLRIHNGHDGHDASTDEDDALGKVYFEDLELVAPAGWTLLEAHPSPSTGGSYAESSSLVWPLVAPIGDGTLHMLPQQAMFHRRLILCRTGEEAAAAAHLAEEGLAFCRSGTNSDGQELLSWWNDQTPRYFTQNIRLPQLDYLRTREAMRAELSNSFDSVRAAHDAGTAGPWPIVSGELGWAHPWGVSIGYMHGGSEINFWDGVKVAWAASQDGYRQYQLTHRMTVDRHPTALYDKHGVEHSQEAWLAEGPNGTYLPIYIWMVPWLVLGDPFGFQSSPSFQRDAVAIGGLQPAYEGTLASYENIDSQHLVRFCRSAKVLAWLGNDALAKDDLRLQAELGRSTFNFYAQDQWGGTIATGAKRDAEYAAAHPGDGLAINRGEGWIFDAVVSGYALADPSWRTKVRPWMEQVVELVDVGRSHCTGTIMADPSVEHLGGQYRVLQSISEAILQNGLWGMRSTVFEGLDAERSETLRLTLRDSCASMIGPTVWNTELAAPNFYTAFGPYDVEQPPFCGYLPPDGTEGTDDWQTWSMLVFGYKLSGDPIFLTRATQMADGQLTATNVGVDYTPSQFENRIGILSLLEDLD